MFFYIVMCWIFILEKKIADSQGVVTSIVSSDEIDEGEPFTVTCNALLASVPGDIKTITKLYIRWSEDGNEQYTYYARYRLYIPPYNLTIFSNDTSRTVTVYFSGSLRETSDSTRPENRDTMKIEILFHDAICTDEGYFYCGASYMDAEDFERSTYNKQFLYIFSIAVDPWSFYISPQSQWKYAEGNSINPAGSDVTLFCGVDGPKQLNITWKFRNTSGEISTFIPLQIDYSSSSFRWYSPSIVCHRYYYYSEIRFQTEDKYDGYTFMCLATAYNRDTSIGNMTIHTQKTIAIPAVIREGTNFSLTCEPFLAGVPKNNTKVESLKISWSDETGNTISIAEYWRNNSSYSIPHEMTLASFFTGTVTVDGDEKNKPNSMYIEMNFLDAKCSDAGVYTCQATYTNLDDGTMNKTQQGQTVDSFIPVVYQSLKLDTQYNGELDPNQPTIPEGSNVSLTCNVIGPRDLTFKWVINNTVEVKRLINNSNEETAVPVPASTEKPCHRYLHSSTLTFQTEYTFDRYTYVCVATANLQDTPVGNMTIIVQKENTSVAKNHQRYDIVDQAVIVEGRPFTVTCDGSRAGVPENATIILALFIDWKPRMNKPAVTYASCTSVAPYKFKAPLPKDWQIYCDGIFNTTTQIPNRNEMQLKIIINDSNSDDAGVYFCNATYVGIPDREMQSYNYQYVSVKKPTEDNSFLYYAVPVAAAVLLLAAVAAVCWVKVRRDKARKRRFNLKTLPAIRVESFPPSMDSNGYLLPVDPNGGYAQISDTATYSENYYSSINELDFMNEGAANDGQSDITTGLDENQAVDVDCLSDTETKTDLKFENKMYKQLDAKSDGEVDRTVDKKLDVNMDGEIDIKTIGHVDRKTDGQLDKETDGQLEETKDDKLDIKSDGEVDRTVDDKLDVQSDGEIDFKTIGHLDRKTDGQLDRKTDDHLDRKTDGQLDKETNGQLEKTKYVELDIKRNEDLDIKKDTEQKTGTNKQQDKDQQNESTPADGLNDYAKLYDTPGNVFTPEVNTYVTLKF